MIDQILKARSRGTPLIAISTPDPAATISNIADSIKDAPQIKWDAVRGPVDINPRGLEAMTMADIESGASSLEVFLSQLQKIQPDSVIFIIWGHLFLNDPSVIQAFWNLRDLFESTHCTLILLAPSIKLPQEIAQDFIILEEELPDSPKLEAIITKIVEAANKSGADISLSNKDKNKTIDLLSGMSTFAARQNLSMSLLRTGIDFDELWNLKKSQIKQVPGLAYETSKESLDDLGGLCQIKNLFELLFNGPNAPRLIVRIEELEKAMAGVGGDNNGLADDALGVILTAMEDNGWTGLLAAGPPGSGKSGVSKAAGVSYGVKTLVLDINAGKGGIVGTSEQNIRRQMETIKALGGNRVLFISSVNDLDKINDALRRRYKLGTYFFDFPSDEERRTIWPIHLKKFEIEDDELPNDLNWTGAEIRNVCEIAQTLGCSLMEASNYIVPVYRADKDKFDRMRARAAGKLLATSSLGVYQVPVKTQNEQVRALSI